MAGKFWRNRHAWAAGILLSGLLWGLCGCGTENAAHAPGEQESALYHGSWAVPAEEAVAEDLSAPQGSWQIPLGERESISLSVPEDGEYILLLTYQVKGDIVLRTSLTAQVGEQSCTTQLFSVWRDVTKQYGTDRYGNQILPTQMTEKVPVDDYVRDQTGVDCQPFRFLLTKGEQTLTLESHNADLELSRIRLVRADSVPDYAKYRSALGEREAGKDKIVIQGPTPPYGRPAPGIRLWILMIIVICSCVSWTAIPAVKPDKRWNMPLRWKLPGFISSPSITDRVKWRTFRYTAISGWMADPCSGS